MRLPDFEGWAIFACVVEHRSFSAAAQAIGVSKATVSKAIARLEASLGATLFHRTSRRLTLTDAGQALAERAGRILAEARAAEEQARDAATSPKGLVRLAAPMSLAGDVSELVAAFLADHPGIQIELLLSDATVDIVGEGIDIALRVADLPDSSLRARRLAAVTAHVVCAPSYLDLYGAPEHPSELIDHACFGYTNVANPTWYFRGPDGEDVAVRPTGPLSANNGEAMLPALRAGLGIARLPDFIVGADLAAGRLVTILERWSAQPRALHLVTPPGSLRPQRVEALIAFLSERMRRAT